MKVSGQLHAPAALPHGKRPWYPMHRRLGGPQSRPGRGGENKNPLPNLRNEKLYTDNNTAHLRIELNGIQCTNFRFERTISPYFIKTICVWVPGFIRCRLALTASSTFTQNGSSTNCHESANLNLKICLVTMSIFSATTENVPYKINCRISLQRLLSLLQRFTRSRT